ncbi:MAG: hypothetical protein KDK36_16670, partial [Leptospiraceae bacterium]|nr:hypothetical protein [Leptospiraceae bacterium]
MKKKFRFSRFILLLFSISLLLISSSYVIANIFAIKGTNFYPLLIGTSDKFYDLIYYSGWLFSFIVIYNLIRDEKFRNNFLSFFGLFLLINLIFMFPVYGILLDKPEIIPYKSLFKEDFMRGISFPLFSLFSLFLLIKLFRNLDKKIKNYYIVTLFVIGTIFFIFLQGKIFSRLEDEFAYYFQSLIFSNGNLIQKVTPPSGISSNRLKEIIQLPYIFNNDGSLYSAHFHGWSFLIYLFDLISLREYSNY